MSLAPHFSASNEDEASRKPETLKHFKTATDKCLHCSLISMNKMHKRTSQQAQDRQQ